MFFNDPTIQTIKEIEEFAIYKKKLAELNGLTFDVIEFINRVEYTRSTTHMDLRESFEYERSKL